MVVVVLLLPVAMLGLLLGLGLFEDRMFSPASRPPEEEAAETRPE